MARRNTRMGERESYFSLMGGRIGSTESTGTWQVEIDDVPSGPTCQRNVLLYQMPTIRTVVIVRFYFQSDTVGIAGGKVYVEFIKLCVKTTIDTIYGDAELTIGVSSSVVSFNQHGS